MTNRIKYAYFSDGANDAVVKIAVNGETAGTRYKPNGVTNTTNYDYSFWKDGSRPYIYPITYKQFKQFLIDNGHIKSKIVPAPPVPPAIKAGDVVKYNGIGGDLFVLLVTEIKENKHGNQLKGITLERNGVFDVWEIGKVVPHLFGFRHFNKISPKWD
jgi:hypothetical protein